MFHNWLPSRCRIRGIKHRSMTITTQRDVLYHPSMF
jgi:hypothetical protein